VRFGFDLAEAVVDLASTRLKQWWIWLRLGGSSGVFGFDLAEAVVDFAST
jgi:hypothetical protein